MIKLALIDNGIPYHMRNNRNQRIVHKSFLAFVNAIQVEYKDDKIIPWRCMRRNYHKHM